MKKVLAFADKHWYLLSMLLIFSYILFSGIQTICYSDEGYFGSAYQNFFDAHETIYTTDSYYLSILVGAIWDKLFGNYGIFSYTILAGIFSCITFHFVQRTLLKVGCRDRWYITLGFFITLLYGFTYLINNIHITCLLLSIEGCLIVESCKERLPRKLFLASFLGVLNVFSRIPNVLLLLLLLIPIIAVRKDKRLIVSYLINAIVGGLFALFVMFVLMQCLGHWVYFYKATFENLAIEAASGEESIHSLSTLMNRYICYYGYVIVLILLIGALVFLRKLFDRRSVAAIYSIAVVYLMIISMYLLRVYVYVHSFCFIIYSVGLYCLFYNIIINKHINHVLYSIALGIALLMPVGTDAGIAALGGQASMFMLPLAFSEVGKAISKQNCKARDINYLIVNTLIIFFILFRIRDMVIFGTWAEGGSRLYKTEIIENSKYATVLVSRERANEIDPVLKVLSKYVKEGDYLFCFKDIPIFNYLTRTKPYAYCSEPGFIHPSLFKFNLEQAEREIKIYPVLIKQKVLVRNPGWEKHEQILEDFIYKNKYERVWDNKKFEILISNSHYLNE